MNRDAIRKHHDLKCIPAHFEALTLGRKNFEVRINDRDFQVGDSVTLHEYFPDTAAYSGAVLSGIIGYLTNYGQKDGYVVFSLVLTGICIV